MYIYIYIYIYIHIYIYIYIYIVRIEPWKARDVYLSCIQMSFIVYVLHTCASHFPLLGRDIICLDDTSSTIY